MRILIKNAVVMLPEEVKQGVDVYLGDGKILAIDRKLDKFVAEKVIDGTDKLLMPGFINAHTHAYMTVFRNAADDLLFNDWLFGKILPMEERLTAERCYYASLLACMEMLSTGTTCFSDMYIFTDTVVKAANECGMRAVLGRGLAGGKDDVAGGKRRLKEAREEILKWKDVTERITFRLAPHAPYTCDFDYQCEVADVAKELNVGIHIHLAESLDEAETIRKRYGCGPVELMGKTGLLNKNTVAAHCVQIDEKDMELLAKRGVSVATNPVSNLKLANGVAPVPKMMEKGINVCLGTDGTASNNTLNMVREMSFLALIHKGINHDATVLPARMVLNMATKNGAEALGLEKVGEIREGWVADLVLVDLAQINMQPNNNPMAGMVYSANGTEVCYTIVNGEILYENGKFLTIDRDLVLRKLMKK